MTLDGAPGGLLERVVIASLACVCIVIYVDLSATGTTELIALYILYIRIASF